jgi:hypothetical protein
MSPAPASSAAPSDVAPVDLIYQQLLPNAKDANVTTFVAGVRAKVAMHLQHAKDLQVAMAK